VRTINFLLLVAALASAFALYVLKYDTRRMEARVQALERTLQATQREIARLKGEYAHLARPDRIEPMARGLGLAPIGPRQYLRIGATSPDPAQDGAPAASTQ
jgi:cell division protein FtsL